MRGKRIIRKGWIYALCLLLIAIGSIPAAAQIDLYCDGDLDGAWCALRTWNVLDCQDCASDVCRIDCLAQGSIATKECTQKAFAVCFGANDWPALIASAMAQPCGPGTNPHDLYWRDDWGVYYDPLCHAVIQDSYQGFYIIRCW